MEGNEKCITGKQGYATRADANTQGRALTRRSGQQTYTYRCKECDQWHLTRISRERIKNGRWDIARENKKDRKKARNQEDGEKK